MKELILLLIVITSSILPQKKDHSLMIATEYRFAESAARDGIRQSFLNFIAEDGILFRPAPVKGKDYLLNSKPGNGYLSWYPTRSDISGAGDMGFTTGPWSFRKEKDSLEIAFGEFCTVWEKQEDGSFKFAIDYGISHPKPVVKDAPIKNKLENFLNSQLKSETKPSDIRIIEKRLNDDNSMVYSDQSRLLMNDSFPFDGDKTIDKLFHQDRITGRNYSVIGGKTAKSSDFGFTYGELSLKKGESSRDYYYFRVWKLIQNNWIVLTEVWNEKK